MPEDPDLLLESVAAYRLPHNDAVIVAACQYILHQDDIKAMRIWA